MTSIKRLTFLALTLALTACAGTAETLGLGRNAPDEFAVVDRPPLAMPPEFALSPPRPGAPRPQEVSVETQAKSTLFGASASQDNDHQSSVEEALLAATGADKADPSIRETIDREASEKVVGSEHLVERLLWWHDPSYGSTTVDPFAEKERLESAKVKGESANEGATPIIEKNKSGWLGL